jgi:hypothetical protein
VQTQIRIGMSFRIGGDLGEPGTWHHHTGGSDGVLIQSIEAGGVNGVRYSKIVGVDDKEFRIGWIAQAFSDSFRLCLAGRSDQ